MSFNNFHFNRELADADNVYDAPNLIKRVPISRALSICDKLLDHIDNKLGLYSGLARIFNASMSKEQIREAIEESGQHRITLRFQLFHDAFTMCSPNNGKVVAAGGGVSHSVDDVASGSEDHIISFNTNYITTVNSNDVLERNRCCFLHLAKWHKHWPHTSSQEPVGISTRLNSWVPCR